MSPFGMLWGHYSLLTASEAKYDLKFELSDFDYMSDLSLRVPLLVKKWLYSQEEEEEEEEEVVNDDPLTCVLRRR